MRQTSASSASSSEYRRLTEAAPRERYAYASPAFGVFCELTYDERGVVLAYPGIALRVA